jgi:glycerol kinase
LFKQNSSAAQRGEQQKKMKRKYIGALDQGTASTRFFLFSKEGQIISSHQIEHTQIYPRPGWVEHDPATLWENTCRVIEAALSKAKIRVGEIDSVGITNQRETTLTWDRRTGRPFCNAIVWQDTRTQDMCDSWSKEAGIDRFREKTGLPVSTYFSASKLAWLMANVPDFKKAAETGEACFGTVDSWIVWRLTGGPNGGNHVTDVTNASRTLLFNLKELTWDEELLEFFGIPPQILPEVKPSVNPDTFGITSKDGPFGEKIPITGILGDQQAALFGQTCFQRGETKNTYGTGCFMLTNTGEDPVPSRCGLINTVGYKIGNNSAVYALEGSVAIAGALVQWFRDNLGIIKESPEIEKLAAGVPDNGGVYCVPAFSGLFAPYWESSARGIIAGITHSTNRGHLARAVLEATAFQTREIFDAMQQDTGMSIPVLKVDGGMTANNLLMQFQADILGIPVLCSAITETTALGACYAAGLGTSFWGSLDEIKHNWRSCKSWQCSMPRERSEEMLRYWRKTVSRSVNWLTK